MEMFRYLRSRIPGAQEAKRLDRDEYFELNQTLYHGFPAKATCMCYDEELQLLAIGTKTGSIRVYGAPGVEVTAEHPHETCIEHIYFVPSVGRLLTLCSDSSLHAWSLVNTRTPGAEPRLTLRHERSVSTDNQLKTITASALMCKDAAVLLLGTETGNVHAVDMATLAITDLCIYEDVLQERAPDDFKSTSAGHVEALACRDHLMIIGYTRGLIVLYDTSANAVVNMYVATQGVEAVAFQGTSFVSTHNDGSYVVWSLTSTTPLHTANIPFGPFPCKPIDRVLCATLDRDDDAELMVFTGGMPRASFGDKSTVAVQAKHKQLVFDCTSAVLDVLTIGDTTAHTLLILCEEELIAIDLTHEDWLPHALPYMHPLHASPITACVHVAGVDDRVWTALQAHRATYVARKYSTRDWPIGGGVASTLNTDDVHELLVTGHEDGNVRVWTCNQVSMQLMATTQTARLFDAFADDTAAVEEDDWPPFRKAGHYDPYSDDPRVSVQRVAFDGRSGTMVVGGSAGHVCVYALKSGEAVSTQRLSCTIVGADEQFKWKGNDALAFVEREPVDVECFEATALLQMHPPAAVTAVGMDGEKKVLAAGTAHGFVVYDYARNESMLTKCLLSADDIALHTARTFDGAMNRFKSFKKSVRDSIRRRRRTARALSPRDRTTSPAQASQHSTEAPPPPNRTSPSQRHVRIMETPIDDDLKPIERQIGSRQETQNIVALPSLVRTIVFAHTHLLNATDISHTVWIGTNAGKVYAHTIDTNAAERPIESGDADIQPVTAASALTCTLAKEVHLRHGAPVLSIQIMDIMDTPINGLPAHVVTPSTQHRVIMCTEEQLKAFTLPALRPTHYKYKLTAHEGVRMRRITTAVMTSKKDPTKTDTFLLVMTNNGTVHAFGSRHMRRYMHEQCVRDPNDIHAVLSTVLTNGADVLSLTARGSEWVRSSLAANDASQLRARCHLPALASASTPAIAVTECEAPTGEQYADTTLNSTGVSGDQTLDSIRDYTDDHGADEPRVNGDGADAVNGSATQNGHGATDDEGAKDADNNNAAPPAVNGHKRQASVAVSPVSAAADGKDVEDEIAAIKAQVLEKHKSAAEQATADQQS